MSTEPKMNNQYKHFRHIQFFSLVLNKVLEKLSLNGLIYEVIYLFYGLKDGDNDDTSTLKKSAITTNCSQSRVILCLGAYVAIATLSINSKFIIIVSYICATNIIYLLNWQVAFLFDHENEIDDIPRKSFSINIQVILSAMNFIEIIFLYGILYEMNPCSFHGSLDVQGIMVEKYWGLYFSVINIATVGFGDIYPITIISRYMVISQIIIGMIYIIVNLPLLFSKADK